LEHLGKAVGEPVEETAMWSVEDSAAEHFQNVLHHLEGFE
jgi:hypothetical protein